MLIQYLVDPKAYFYTNNKPKDLTPDEENYEAKKAILAARVRHYIEKEAKLVSNMRNNYSIIWGQCTTGLQSVLKGNADFHSKSKIPTRYG